METSDPADEEDLPTFTFGLDFLTPEKKRKEKEQARPVSSCLAKLLIFRSQFCFLRTKTHLFETIN